MNDDQIKALMMQGSEWGTRALNFFLEGWTDHAVECAQEASRDFAKAASLIGE